ncbi:MAG: hypothetical protein ACOX4K_06685 [Bacillota bacterium]
MKDVLTFLQIFQLLGKWAWTVIANLHIISSVVIILGMCSRLNSGQFWPLSFWEFMSVLHLAIRYRVKSRKNKNDSARQRIVIENRNIVQVSNTDYGQDSEEPKA